MKKAFMIEIDLPEDPGPEFFSLIPEQRAAINQMMEDGKILSYSLSEDRAKLWVVVAAESEFEALDYVADFPMVAFMTPFVTELMFHNMVSLMMPISLN